MTPLQRKVLHRLLEFGASDESDSCWQCGGPREPLLNNIAEPHRDTARELLDALTTDRIEVLP